MSELRRDPVSRHWVIIASERGKRPGDFVQSDTLQVPKFDPFAEGNESKTLSEIAAYREAGTQANKPGWRVRVVPNKFPALQVEGPLGRKAHGVYDGMNGIGAHEIIIETPQCVPSFTSLPDRQVEEILWMYRERLLDLKQDKRLRYGLVFKNVGAAAGATMYHSHSQLIATPMVPQTVETKIRSCDAYMEFRDRCLLCDLLAQEQEEQQRVILESGQFTAFAPYASKYPFETWIVSRDHASHFENLNESSIKEFAFILKRTLLKLEKGLGQLSYNYMLVTAPFQDESNDRFHWHLEITPRIFPVAGFERGTGFYINSVPPEDAAEFLRGLAV